jgi:hypothetical protein
MFSVSENAVINCHLCDAPILDAIDCEPGQIGVDLEGDYTIAVVATMHAQV